MSSDRTFREGDAPTPFSAAEIRLGCPDGRRVIVRHDTDGSIQYWATTFVNGDMDGTELINQQVDEAGEPIGEEQRFRVAWKDLQGHASFPEAATQVKTETVELTIGKLECLVYTVTDGDLVRSLWFAVDRPGLPVMTRDVGPATRSESTVISDSLV